MQVKSKKTAAKIIVGLIILLLLAMITGFQPLYWILYLVVAGTVVGYLWAWLQSRALDVQVRGLSAHPQVGQTVFLKVEITEKLGVPRVGLRTSLVGDFADAEEEDLNLEGRGTASWTVSGTCRRRGLNTVGSLAVVSTDPTGFLRMGCRVGQPQTILVYPSTVELSATLIEGQSRGGEIGESGQLIGHSPAASMVRQYVAGDSLAHIHWPTTARLDQLMTKEFEGAGINEIWLFVDLHGEVQSGTGDDSTEEYGITIAASLAKCLMRDGHAVGMVIQGDQFYKVNPSKEPGHLWDMLQALALVRATGKTPLPQLISQESGNLGPGSVAIAVAPWPGQSISAQLQFLARRGILVVPILLDAASFGRLPESTWLADARTASQEWGFVVRSGDDLSTSLRYVLDQIAAY